MLRQERNVVRLVGRKRFGTPTPDQEAGLDAVTDHGRLERMFDATDWDDLLATP